MRNVEMGLCFFNLQSFVEASKDCRRASKRNSKSLRKLVCVFVGPNAVCFGERPSPPRVEWRRSYGWSGDDSQTTCRNSANNDGERVYGNSGITYALPRPPGGAPVSPSAMTRAETEKALVEDSAGRVSLVKDWRSILVDVSGRGI